MLQLQQLGGDLSSSDKHARNITHLMLFRSTWLAPDRTMEAPEAPEHWQELPDAPEAMLDADDSVFLCNRYRSQMQ